MDVISAFIFCFLILIYSSIKGIFVGYALVIGLILFIIVACKKGFHLFEVIKMAYKGGKKSFIVLEIFILIGAVTSTWMASGTVPAIVYYGIKFLNPNTFIVCVFLITSIVSFLIGTSFGTVGTVGIAFMVIARGGNVNTSLTAGAILAGAYFGDRCSPMSSSANLVASITNTRLYSNIKNMFTSSLIPFMISVVIYLAFSLKSPLNTKNNYISSEIIDAFHINIFTLMPATIILVFCILKINVKKSILISIIIACIIGITIQHVSIANMIRYIICGYSIEINTQLSNIIKGGGILSMLKSALVVFVSSAFTGIFEETKMLNNIEEIINKSNGRIRTFITTIIVSFATSAFGCSQALAVILTHMLVHKNYEKNNIDKEILSLDIENSAIIIAPLVPWNIAVLVPLTTLNANTNSMLYAFYLYLTPIINLMYLKYKEVNKPVIQNMV